MKQKIKIESRRIRDLQGCAFSGRVQSDHPQLMKGASRDAYLPLIAFNRPLGRRKQLKEVNGAARRRYPILGYWPFVRQEPVRRAWFDVGKECAQIRQG